NSKASLHRRPMHSHRLSASTTCRGDQCFGEVALAVHPASILPGYRVYAHHVDARNRLDLGQYVGSLEDILTCRDVHYLHVRGGLEGKNELFIPLGAVRAVGARQVHLTLSLEELAAQAWHVDPR